MRPLSSAGFLSTNATLAPFASSSNSKALFFYLGFSLYPRFTRIPYTSCTHPMSNALERSWIYDSNSPQIPSWLYTAEKEAFAGFLIGAIGHGIVIVLFLRCVGAMLNPVNCSRDGIKWGLVVHTVATFSLLTIPTAIALSRESMSYIDNRNFLGNDRTPPGPIGYKFSGPNAATTAFVVMPILRKWLTDGFLMYRCYVIYSMNHWVMTFPSLTYLASVATGIAFIYENARPESAAPSPTQFGTSYYSIYFSLNIMLTFMILIRLAQHIKLVRDVMKDSSGASGFATVVTLFVESFALYVVAFLLYIVPWALGSWTVAIFSELLRQVEVIAPYLIILRVANRRALTSEVISGSQHSIHFRGEGTMDDGRFLPEGSPMEMGGGVPVHSIAGAGNAAK